MAIMQLLYPPRGGALPFPLPPLSPPLPPAPSPPSSPSPPPLPSPRPPSPAPHLSPGLVCRHCRSHSGEHGTVCLQHNNKQQQILEEGTRHNIYNVAAVREFLSDIDPPQHVKDESMSMWRSRSSGNLTESSIISTKKYSHSQL